MSDIDDELFALAGGDDDGDVEEGEASSVAASSPNSLGSDAMEESDSDADDDVPTKDSDVPYPLEGKYQDAKDKAYIQGLPQLERERILGERAEEQSQAQFNAELARRAKVLDKTSDRKRKASSIEPDDSQRKSSRQKVKGKPNNRLEEYKQAREQRGQQRQRQDDRRNGRHRSSSESRDGASDIDAEGESEVEYAEYDKKPREEDLPAELRHFEAVRVGRGLFSTVCFYPGFEQVMTGTYVRVGTGQDAHHRTLYKMAQIKGFTTGKPYVFEGKNGERIATDQYVTTQHGTHKKDYNFSFLSNQRFTDADLDTYKQSLAETNSKIPAQSTLKRKYNEIGELRDRYWTDADITERIAKANKYKYLLTSKSSENAGPKIATQSQLEAQRIAEINRQNRKQDSERVRMALLEERRHALQERKRLEKEAQQKRKEEEERKKVEEEKAAKKANLDDLFEGDSRAGTPRAGTPKPGEKKEKKKGLPTFRKPKMDDDIIAAMDLGVEIEI